jgi:phosphopantothenoylcysteine decarboxylase/phosphopantothenate--cysteine ligase
MIETIRKSKPLYGKKVLITAGPTYEPIDPVRFIGNRSTGKMGFALADRAMEFGAEVHLVSGPTTAVLQHKPHKHVKVETALEMFESCKSVFPECDIAIFTAAVSDYRVRNVASEKMKKGEEVPSIELIENPDILKTLAAQKSGQIVVGFALETENEIENAKVKLDKKNADLIVLNSLRDKKSGFGHDTNTVYLITKDNSPEKIELKAKTAIAVDLWNYILKNWF